MSNLSLSSGRAHLAIPGPSPLPERVIRAMARPSPDIYGEELAALNRQMIAGLKRVAGTTAHLAPYIGNGHAAWEAANANMLDRGDRALLLCSGHFGRAWGDNAAARGIEVQRLEFGPNAPDPARLAQALADDADHQIKAVLVCQTDTASSVLADIPALRRAMGDHPALLVVDAIASLGCEPMFMDEWGVDVLVSASQKGLMAPPGMGFVWFSDKARARARSSLSTPYWDWKTRIQAQQPLWQYWGGTPPVQLIYAMTEAVAMIEEDTLPAIWARHQVLANATSAAIDAWGAGNPAISHLVADPAARAHAVTAVNLPGADRLRDWCRSKAGLTLGISLGTDDPANGLRIAQMGHVNAHQHLGTLATIQAGLVALDIPHGPGALDGAVQVIAQATRP